MSTKSSLRWLVCVVLCLAAGPTWAEVIQTRPVYPDRVGTFVWPVRLALDPGGSRLYISCQQSASVAVVDTTTHTVVGTVQVGRFPLGIAVDPTAGALYVANGGDDTVTVHSTLTLEAIGTVHVANPAEVAVDPSRQRLYVLSKTDESVSVIDTNGLGTIESIDVGSEPTAVAANTDTGEIYVANAGSDTISVISGQDFSQTAVGNSATLGDISTSGNNSPNHIAYDEGSGFLFVANTGSKSVNVIRTDTLKIVETIEVDRQPQYITVDAARGRVYVSNRGDYTVSVLSTSRLNVIETLGGDGFFAQGSVGSFPMFVLVDPLTSVLYVITDWHRDIYAVSADTGRMIRNITLWGGLSDIAIRDAGDRMYVLDMSADELLAIHPETMQVSAVGDGGRSVRGMAYNSAMDELYVVSAYTDGDRARVFDGETLRQVDSIGTGGSTAAVGVDPAHNIAYIAVGWGDQVLVADGIRHSIVREGIPVATGPSGVAVNPMTRQVFVVGETSNTVTVIDGDTNAVLANVRVDDSPRKVAVNQSLNRAYVTNSGSDTVSVIDGVSLSVVDSFHVGSDPQGIAVSPTTNEIYVANSGDNTLSVVEAGTHRLLVNVTTGRQPWGVAIHPARDALYVTNRGEGSITVIEDLVRDAFPTPPLVSPASDSTVHVLTPTLSWTAVQGGVSYSVQVAADATFDELLVDTSGLQSSQYTVASGLLEYNHVYAWRLKARYVRGLSGWSESWALNVGNPSFVVPLSAGLNMISLPLDPEEGYTAKTLGEELGATTIIQFDALAQRFVPFVPDVSRGDGFDIEGGRGYIVNLAEDVRAEFTGTAWIAAPSIRVSPKSDHTSTWALAVVGRIPRSLWDAELRPARVEVRNRRTGVGVTDVALNANEEFALAFADMTQSEVVRVGDVIEITVRDRRGRQIAPPIQRHLTQRAIRNAVLSVPLTHGADLVQQSDALQNYPNPFNPETWIPYQLSEPADVVIRIYDISGRVVRTLTPGYQEPGVYWSRARAAHWDGANAGGEPVASGPYLYTVRAGSFRAMRRFVVMR
jgi:YVTN family beta-propeller protein